MRRERKEKRNEKKVPGICFYVSKTPEIIRFVGEESWSMPTVQIVDEGP